MPYAEKTKVSIDKTKHEIEHVLKKHGADRFAYFAETGKAIIVFEANQRRLRFDLPLQHGDRASDEQVRKGQWRALLLCIKAKLEGVARKIETFEEAFLAHVVMPDGKTVYQHTAPRIAQVAKGGELVPLLPGPAQCQ